MVPVEVDDDDVLSRCFVWGCESKERGVRFIFSPPPLEVLFIL